ncbi:preprotein translocase subunit SecA [Streptacidiphilus fuscans]|uniref:Protein translocase subunit SecA n=1 Tax=Streptacidiphilus fuscans TaxID=2789292 RepID=A0A931FGC7_9ACTN|nr:preprotein translocase subunit SecA [Streptacidiphilus fuscans]MBF9072498.1 preprotein translocase subunit SecA [Streptacidiphilus fuscans]
MSVFDKILRAGEGKILRKLSKIAEQVNSIEEDFVNLTDAELRALTDEFRERLADGEKLDDILPEAFAAVREAAKRTLGQRHYDVQLMGGAALHFGYVAEMRTGEGKTLVGTLPTYLNALTGKGVHLITTNDYLAERDSEWMGRVHRFLGLEVGCILANMPPAERREQYNCDITYGTNNEFGFDYLRDNMAWSKDELVQRGHNFAVVDEVDSILIDEARTPLIISGPADAATKWYGDFAKMVQRLKIDRDYEVDEKKRTVGVLEAGVTRVEDYLGIENLYDVSNTPLVGFLNNAIKAKELYKADKDYVVMNGEVMIVDEHTGRILAGRRYNEGMHQAIEAKEGVEVQNENQTLATITLQNFFRLYDKLSGMTGTATTEAAEFHQIYKLGVVPIPTNKPPLRVDQADLIYKSEPAKFAAVVEDIVVKHEKGQPVLVGTTSVEKSEYLSQELRKRGVQHEVLNAKNHEREAQVVAQAGRKGAVTVATNMAGRGTDIMLGGNPEHLAAAELAQRGLSPVDTPEEYEAAWGSALDKAKEAVKAEQEDVRDLGGLYVLGTERHESRRIDNQLRGRSGRQGDPGESRFYLSLGDDLMRLFKAGMVERVLSMANVPEDVPIESKMVTRAIASAQTQVEQQNFEIRKNVLKYDEVLNRQREVIYGERRRVLEGEDLHEQVDHFMDDTIDAYIRDATSEGFAEEWDWEKLWTALGQLYPISLKIEDFEDETGDRSNVTADELADAVKEDLHAKYVEREDQLGETVMRELERRVVLSVLDRRWREHLYEMDYLQEGIGMRALAQRDPLVEYQREGFDMFNAMMDGIKEESVSYLFNLDVQVEQQVEEVPVEAAAPVDAVAAGVADARQHVEIRAKGLDAPQRPDRLHYKAPTMDTADGVVETDIETDVDDETEAGDGLTRAERRKAAKGGRRRKK